LLAQQWYEDFFMPGEWSTLQNGLEQLRAGLNASPRRWDVTLAKEVSRQLDDFAARAPGVAERQVDGLHQAIAQRIARLPTLAGAPGTNTETLRAEGRSFLDTREHGKLSPAQSHDFVVQARAFLDRLQTVERAPEDPCENSVRLAATALATTEYLNRGLVLLDDALNAPCSDVKAQEQVVSLLESVSVRIVTAAAATAIEPGVPTDPTVAAALTTSPSALAGSQPMVIASDLAASGPAGAARSDPGVELDVWQSAWGDFSGIGALLEFASRNQIRTVNLNPGFRITKDSWKEQYRRLKALTDRFRGAGITVNYLYAELNQPLRVHAEFLAAHPDLGIDTLVDDSEFTDGWFESFQSNLREVRAAGLRYAGFVTLEGMGNSGVSDRTRFWAIENLDTPILMSYFGCTLAQQQQQIGPYLQHAERFGRKGDVKVALLLGSKSTGREVSCERLLDRNAFSEFVRSLRAWAATFASFGGLVFETNEKLPRFEFLEAVSKTGRR
jgi:hypothetical protein